VQKWQRSPEPSEPDHASSAQVWQVERGLSMVQVELNWSYWPQHHVIVEAFEG
jgi:hypothetical protein